MLIVLSEALPGEDVARALFELEGATWRDGKATAGAAASAVKRNLQAPGLEGLGVFVREALLRHRVFESAARPRRISPILFSRYEPGMEYGSHTDDALMGEAQERMRTDLAFTLFLSAPSAYQGGALVLESAAGRQEIKLNAGDAMLYPAGAIHSVAPVSAGVRYAAIGWVESFVREAAKREVLYDLSLVRARLKEAGAPREDLLRLDKSVSNLLRMWAET